jgi:SM-20-related protein
MTTKLLNLAALKAAPAQRGPYPHIAAAGLLSLSYAAALAQDFPAIKKPGFFPLDLLEKKGAFATLIEDLQGPELAEILSEKLGLDLRDKPRMITVRKWSAAKDGRIHNDGEAKISTSLIYLDPPKPAPDGAGKFRVLKSDTSFDDMAMEVASEYGNFVAFARTENSWHGHKPFAGERRVIQITWLRSWDDYNRKHKRGHLSHFLKKFLTRSEY